MGPPSQIGFTILSDDVCLISTSSSSSSSTASSSLGSPLSLPLSSLSWLERAVAVHRAGHRAGQLGLAIACDRLLGGGQPGQGLFGSWGPTASLRSTMAGPQQRGRNFIKFTKGKDEKIVNWNRRKRDRERLRREGLVRRRQRGSKRRKKG